MPAYEFTVRRILDAWDIVQRCFGKNGIWADPERYRYTCWTRDTTLAILPILAIRSSARSDELLRRHFDRLAELQEPNGQIPILHLDDESAWVRMKEQEQEQEGKVPFMLRRYREGGIHQLTPGTRDSEILYIKGVLDLYDRLRDRAWLDRHRGVVQKAWQRIEDTLKNDDGLVTGCDWRDTMEVQLGGTTLLSNNALLYGTYGRMNAVLPLRTVVLEKLQKALGKRIRSTFWQNGRLIDRPGSDRIDPLGSSLAVLEGVVTPEEYPAVQAGLREVDSPYGVTIQCQHSAYEPAEKEVIERTQGVVVWPWIVGYTILAALKMGDRSFAEEQYKKWLLHPGFPEWVDPATGKGYGAKEQLWSAAMFLVATDALA